MIVYIYTFPNGKKYVGQTSRPLEQRARSGEGYISSPAVYSAIQKYGWDNIIIETFNCPSKAEMDQLEQYYIQLYKTYDNNYGYNLTLGGDGTTYYDYDKVCELWNKGLNIGKIAEQVGCKPHTVTCILKAKQLYNYEEVLKRKNEVNKKAGIELQQYYTSFENQEKRKINGLKGAQVRSKPVFVFKDKDQKEFVGYYKSGREAAKALNITHSTPSYALTHNHYGGGYWFYLESDLRHDDKTARECDWYRWFGGQGE